MRFPTALGCHIEIKIGAGESTKAEDVTMRGCAPNGCVKEARQA
jgi:hypothetical protein